MKTTHVPNLLLLLLLTCLFPTIQVKAQHADTVSVSILTIGPGKIIYELEGHAAIRVSSPSIGDYAVDWGRFDFNSPNFVYRFTAGETDYRSGIQPTALLLQQARAEGRRVTENKIILTPGQADTIVTLLQSALLPQNSVYRYNYIKDNCSTRVFKTIEQALGTPIKFGALPPDLPSDPTFRSLMAHYHRDYPWYQFGIDLALGSSIDKKIDSRQSAFAPVILERLFPDATISGQPVVSETIILVPDPPRGISGGPSPFLGGPLVVASLILVITIAVTIYDVKCCKRSRWLDTILYGTFTLLGLVLTFLIFISVHEATSPNWIYLWLNPLNIIAAVGIWLKKLKRIVFYYQIINFVSLLALIVIGITGIQTLNSAVYLLVIADITRALFAINHYVKASRQ